MTSTITSLVSRLDNFVSVYPMEGEAEVFGLLDGAYALLVRVETGPHAPVIVFSFYNENADEIMAEKHLDYADFIHGLEARYLQYALNKSFGKVSDKGADELLMKSAWKIEALKDLFADRIEGDDEFWKRFNWDLERILKPIASEMLRNAIIRDQLSVMIGPL